MRSYYIHTYGCQMNEYDSGRIAAILESMGALPAAQKDAELIILNTCSVREKPQHKVESHIGKLRQSQTYFGLPLKIGVMGCVAGQEGDNFLRRFPCVDFVLGTDNIAALPSVINEIVKGKRVSETAFGGDEEFNIPSFERKSAVSAYVTIMKGCDNFCSYCIVPYVRGREKSRPQSEILDEIKNAVKAGAKEIILLGQNVNSYGKDRGADFAGLLGAAAEINGVSRLRFITSHPKDFSMEIVKSMARYSNICPYVHIPLQSGSDAVLKRMNRGYSWDEYRGRILEAKEILPNILFSSDFILGFPGETETDFQSTLSAVREMEYEMIFAFNYSARPRTKAEVFEDDVPRDVKSARLQALIEMQEGIIAKRYARMIGAKIKTLVEGVSKRDKSVYTGRTEYNRVMNFTSDIPVNPGDIVGVRLTEVKRSSLFGRAE